MALVHVCFRLRTFWIQDYVLQGVVTRMQKLLALGVSGALLIGGGAFGATQMLAKNVSITIDGTTSQLRVTNPTVAGVLISQGVKLGQHDVVTPAPNAPVSDGQQIEVRYGREITALVDGVPTKFWTTALTVEEALDQLNIRSQNFTLSTSRSTSIGREGLDFQVDSQYRVSVQAGGKTQQLTLGGTVRDALTKAGVGFDSDDIISTSLDTQLSEGMNIKLVKVDTKTVVKSVPIKFTTTKKDSPTLYKGETEIKTKGVNGTKTETWIIRIEDGVPVKQSLSQSVITKQPTTQVELTGTKKKPATSSDSSTTGSNSSSTSTSTGSTNTTPASGNTCKASYYWDPQPTASGEWFNPNAMTAAHKTLKLGSMVKVTNPSNGRTVVVRINDRGPYIAGRCLDLSRAAMQAIGGTSAGVITVNWQVI